MVLYGSIFDRDRNELDNNHGIFFLNLPSSDLQLAIENSSLVDDLPQKNFRDCLWQTVRLPESKSNNQDLSDLSNQHWDSCIIQVS